MRLTKYDRQAFVSAVLDDIPKIDYEAKAHKLIREFAITTFPEELRPLVKKYPEFFQDRYVGGLPHGLRSMYAKIRPDVAGNLKKYSELWDQLVELGKQQSEQNNALEKQRAKLEAVISQCSTLKVARERLPEFDKYLPQDKPNSVATNLPVANLVSDLMALGWPKGKNQ